MKTYTENEVEQIKRAVEVATYNKAIAKVREMYDAYQKNSALFLDTPEAAVYKVLTALMTMAGEK